MAEEPMSTTGERSPEEIRRDIEATRADMGRTMNQIEDRVSPTAIRERQTERLRGRWSRIRTSVMGSPDSPSSGRSPFSGGGSGESVADKVRGQGEDAAAAVKQTPDRLQAQTRGNPLAAGAIAFGVGALVGSVLPASQREQQAASAVREQAEQPLKEGLKQVGEQTKEDLQPAVQDAADQTKQRATEAAQTTKDEAQSRAHDVQDRAREGAQQTREA